MESTDSSSSGESLNNESLCPFYEMRKSITRSLREKLSSIKASESELDLVEKLHELVDFCCNFGCFIKKEDIRHCLIEKVPTYIFQYQVSDYSLVAEYLRCVSRLQDHSEEEMKYFYISALMKNKTLHDYTIKERENNGLQTYSYIQYFMRCATQCKLTISDVKVSESLFDTHIETSFLQLHFADPLCILTVLQHGACFLDQGYEGSVHPILTHSLDFLIFWGVVLKQWVEETLEFLVNPECLHRDINAMREILLIMFRFVDNPHILSIELVKQTAFHILPDLSAMRSFYDNMFVGRELGRVRASSLMHLCRYAIRNYLDKNWNLPEGVSAVGLPNHLVKYVNLERD